MEMHINYITFISNISFFWIIKEQDNFSWSSTCFIQIYKSHNKLGTTRVGGSGGVYGTQFFCFRTQFCQKAPASEIHAPNGPTPPYGKSWIRHCHTCYHAHSGNKDMHTWKIIPSEVMGSKTKISDDSYTYIHEVPLHIFYSEGFV